MHILNSGFSNYSDADLLTKAKSILHSLQTPPGSIYFPATVPDSEQLSTTISDFELGVEQGNAPGAAEDRAVSRAALISDLRRLALNLEDTPGADRAKLAHTGYDLSKIPAHDPSPTGIPGDVRVKTTGLPGQAKLNAKAVSNAKSYEARATQDLASGEFTSCPPSTGIRGLLFTDLERGKEWFFQIRALGPNGLGPWSDPAMMMVV